MFHDASQIVPLEEGKFKTIGKREDLSTRNIMSDAAALFASDMQEIHASKRVGKDYDKAQLWLEIGGYSRRTNLYTLCPRPYCICSINTPNG